jgi:hypothetical protein
MRKSTVFLVGAMLLAIILLAPQCQEPDPSKGNITSTSSEITTISSPLHPNLDIELAIKFPDFGAMLDPGDYKGRVFLLSQDFPKDKPEPDEAVQNILSIDFKTDWKTYALAVRDYVLEGNGNSQDYQNSFYLEDNPVRPWYHVPWHGGVPVGRGFTA